MNVTNFLVMVLLGTVPSSVDESEMTCAPYARLASGKYVYPACEPPHCLSTCSFFRAVEEAKSRASHISLVEISGVVGMAGGYLDTGAGRDQPCTFSTMCQWPTTNGGTTPEITPVAARRAQLFNPSRTSVVLFDARALKRTRGVRRVRGCAAREESQDSGHALPVFQQGSGTTLIKFEVATYIATYSFCKGRA